MDLEQLILRKTENSSDQLVECGVKKTEKVWKKTEKRLKKSGLTGRRPILLNNQNPSLWFPFINCNNESFLQWNSLEIDNGDNPSEGPHKIFLDLKSLIVIEKKLLWFHFGCYNPSMTNLLWCSSLVFFSVDPSWFRCRPSPQVEETLSSEEFQ